MEQISHPPNSKIVISLEDGANSRMSKPPGSFERESTTSMSLEDGANSLISKPPRSIKLRSTPLNPLEDGATSLVSQPPGSIKLEVKNAVFVLGLLNLVISDYLDRSSS